MKIVFMGTPEFAVPSLVALNRSAYNILLVVTQPDRPKGRGRKTTPPPVKATALANGLPVRQPASLRSAEFQHEIQLLQPDAIVVVAFGQILTPHLLSAAAFGAINLHASLLPKYRGPAPIQWAIINGEKNTGVTTMLMEQGVDTGPILMSAATPIAPNDTAGSLHDRLAALGARLLVRTLQELEQGSIVPRPQDHSQQSHAPLLKKSDGHIDWCLPSARIDAAIRGLNPWPGAYTFLNEQRIRIYKAQPLAEASEAQPGTVLPSFPDELRVATGQGSLSILELQSASGKRLHVSEFLRGHRITAGTVLN